MPVKIAAVEEGSLAEALGWRPGDQVVAVNGEAVEDELDFRFKTSEEELELKVRLQGKLEVQHVTKDYDEGFGVQLEEFRIKTCGDDCVFCFVDQNPLGLRETLYFRDGDFRLSFLYGNYVTVTNLRERDLKRIVEQRLSPLYISVHCTDDAVRRALMGHRTQHDRQAEKLRFFHDHGIEMHAQIVLTPGFNDGGALVKTILDLYALHARLFSVTVVPVGLTRLREGLTELRTVAPAEAEQLVRLVRRWQAFFRERIGRGFVYLSDEMYLLAGEDFPQEDEYDGYPLMENGVGMCRDFLNELAFQAEDLPAALEAPRRLTLATGTLAAPILIERVKPVLERVEGLSVDVVPCENLLLGDTVTVSGLLNYRSFWAALKPLKDAGRLGDLVLLPPDSVNFEGKFLDEAPGKATPADLAAHLGVPVEVFQGDWVDVAERLAEPEADARAALAAA
ncbi:MAG TPA: DUF512 domain-containing protein [Rubricoccaceae bacterium]|nr:DUF512 domain-containing protein [Rubricoccaceae bacterium]